MSTRLVWTPALDAALLEIVNNNPRERDDQRYWSWVAQQLPLEERRESVSKLARKTHSRYINHLDPTLGDRGKRSYWTAAQDQELVQLVERYGTHWNKIVLLLSGDVRRSQLDARNRYYRGLRAGRKVRRVSESPPVENEELAFVPELPLEWLF